MVDFNKSEWTHSLDPNPDLSVEYLFVTLMLKLACENSIRHKVLTEERGRITQDIARYQKKIEAHEHNFHVCEQRIQKFNDYILKKDAKKKKFLDLYQEFLELREKQRPGDFPKSPREIELRENFITTMYKFHSLPTHKSLPPLDTNTIYFKIDSIEAALFCTLKTNKRNIMQMYISVSELWFTKSEDKDENFQCDLDGFRTKKISEFCISLLENLAKKKLIPDPYEEELKLYPEKIERLENLIKDAHAKLEKMQNIQKDNICQKAEREKKLIEAQQKLTATEIELEALTPQLSLQNALFFASREYHKMIQFYFFNSREHNRWFTEKEDKLAFLFKK